MEARHALGYSIDAAKRRVLVTYLWRPDFAQWQAAVEEIFKDPDYQPDYDLLFDRTAIHEPSSTAFIKSMVSYIDRHWKKNGPVRWSFATHDIGSFGTGRMAEQLTDYPGSVRIFKSMADATAWLDEMKKEKAPG